MKRFFAWENLEKEIIFEDKYKIKKTDINYYLISVKNENSYWYSKTILEAKSYKDALAKFKEKE